MTTREEVMEVNEIRRLIYEAKEKNKTIYIKGYKSSSDGSVRDLEIRLKEPGLYKDLIKRSLDDLPLMVDQLCECPDGVDSHIWDEAVGSTVRSWAKSIVHPTKQKKSKLKKMEDGYYMDPDKPEITVVKDALLVSEKIVVAPTRGLPSGDLAKAKSNFVGRTKMAFYMRPLYLAPDKFHSMWLL